MSEIEEKIGQTRKREGPFPALSENWEASSPAERLKTAVMAAGGLKAASQRAGVPLRTLGTYTRGGEMKLSNLRQLADATGVTVEWLATGRGPMRPGETPPPPPELPAAPPPRPAPLFSSVNMDRLAAAYLAARTALAGGEPRPIDLVRIMALIYDQLTETDAASRNKEP